MGNTRSPLKPAVCLGQAAMFLVLLIIAVAPVWSQGFQGTIRGVVQDSSGALIPNAEVTIRNTATGETRSQLSSSTGTFNFPGLLVGDYTVTVELQGFAKLTHANVAVSANTVADVVARLEVGAIAQEIAVVATSDLVKISSAQLEGYVTRNVPDYPNGIRSGDPNNLAILAPGTTTMPGGMAGQGGSVGGNRPRNNNFVVDGVDNNDPTTTGQMTPIIGEAVEEFTLLTNQFNAEYGHSTAGQFITTTKTGSNELHGRLWWYNQNRHLNSLDNLRRASTKPGDPKPRFDWNRFGGQAGGPAIKNKLFFFSSYEYQDKNLAGTGSGEIFVPTAAGLATLQGLANVQGTGVSKTNVDLLANLVPVAPTQAKTTTVRNELTGTDVAIGLGPFSTTTPQYDRTHLFLVNGDYQTNLHRVSGRYSYSRNPFVQAGALPTEQFNSNVSIMTNRITFADVWTVNARTVNELRVGYNRANDNRPVNLPPAPGRTDVFGNYNITDQSLFIGPQSVFPQSSVRNIYQFSNNVSYIRGAHTLKFGAELRNIIAKTDFLARARGEYTWNSLDDFARDRFPITTSIRGTGLGAFSQNRTAYYAFAQDNWKIHPRLTLDYGLRYELTTVARDENLQDLNEISNIVSVTEETYGPDQGVPATDPRFGKKIFDSLPVAQQQAILARVGTSLIFKAPKADTNNFAPRLGLAWDINGDGKTSLRAGAGVATDVVYTNLALSLLPPQIQAENRETTACIVSPSPAWCALVPAGGNPRTADIRFSTTGFIAGGALLPVLPPTTRTSRLAARQTTAGHMHTNEVTPETYTWDLSLQREQFKGWLFEARYVGNHDIHLPVQIQDNLGTPSPFRLPLFLNQADALATNFNGRATLAQFQAATPRILAPYGFNGVVSEFFPDGNSSYHGGSVAVTKRLSRGFELNSNYTYSKTLDSIENEINSSALNPRRPKDMYNIYANKGLSGMHRAHKFVASWLYELPGHPGTGPVARFLSGWSLNGIYIIESGQPITIISGRDVNGDLDSAGDTAFFNPNGQKNIGTDVNFLCWNGTATSVRTSAADCGGNANVVGYVAQNPNAQLIRGQLGMDANLGRNTHIMQGINTGNLAIFKTTPLGGEGRTIQFRFEMWNVFNHPSFTLGTGSIIGQTTAALTTTGYAQPGNGQFLKDDVFSGGLGNAPFQRVIQWGLRLNF